MTVKQRIGQWLFAHMPITRFLFDQIRIEVNALSVWFANRVSPRQRSKLRRIRNADMLYVNVACGPHVIPGFINLDLFATSPEIVRWDCRRSLPLRDNSADGIRAEQFVEHLEVREELPSFLADCRRALKPGGILRVIVPDVRRHMAAYFESDLKAFSALTWPAVGNEFPTKLDMVNHVFHQYQEHRWGYDIDNLRHRLEAAGFVQVTQMDFGKSHKPVLACDRSIHAPYSLYVEAFKPDA